MWKCRYSHPLSSFVLNFWLQSGRRAAVCHASSKLSQTSHFAQGTFVARSRTFGEENIFDHLFIKHTIVQFNIDLNQVSPNHIYGALSLTELGRHRCGWGDHCWWPSPSPSPSSIDRCQHNSLKTTVHLPIVIGRLFRIIGGQLPWHKPKLRLC